MNWGEHKFYYSQNTLGCKGTSEHQVCCINTFSAHWMKGPGIKCLGWNSGGVLVLMARRKFGERDMTVVYHWEDSDLSTPDLTGFDKFFGEVFSW